ncbi:MAG: polysaccharide pyruvyl transferase CsaB [Eubacteriales bacterium]
MKILMATMALDIGGAETHIVELSKALAKEGHEILIASAGGVYVPEVEAVGVRHILLPMNRRRFSTMWRAKNQLAQVIAKEKPDIVHAHARIPAFLCGMLQKKMRFPFVTTAHWVFSAKGMAGAFTNWGQRVIAVSEDIKEYLIEEYHYPAQHISVTINGIDTEKFSPSVQGLREELGISPQASVLCSVSRLDKDRALVAQELIALTPSLAKKIPDFVLLVVGGGNLEKELEEQAEKINESLGRKAIILTGGRTDINRLIATGDIFVGVSRAVLEGMSVGKVSIVAGNEGYQGIFTPDSLAEAVEGNFCCRGMALCSSLVLEEDVVKAFSLSKEEKKKLEIHGREVILSHYSVERMALDCLGMYGSVAKYQVVMSGYYGFDNAGDDAILQGICQEISPEVAVTVLSNNPKETTRQYGLTAVPRYHLKKVARAIKESDAVISGGGSLLQDRSSTRSILYYLGIMALGYHYHKPVMLYANGIGPVGKKSNRKKVVKAVERAQMVTLRDKDSAQELRAMGVQREDLYITADPVQAMTPASPEVGKGYLDRLGITGDFVSISLRDWGKMGADLSELALFCDKIQEKTGYEILFVLMQSVRDKSISEEVQGKMKASSYILEEEISPDALMSVLGQGKFCVAMRLHTLIFSARMGVPLLGLVYDPKVASFLAETEMLSCGDVGEFRCSEGEKQLDQLLEHYDSYVETIVKQQEKLEKKARENQKRLLEMLGQKKGE